MIQLASTAMRTRFELVLRDVDTSSDDLRAAGEEALEEIARVESWLSVYRDDAILYRVNAEAGQRPMRLAAPLFALLQQAQQLSRDTKGAFDLTVGPLVRLWRTAGETGILPTDTDIITTLSAIGMAHVVLLNAEEQTIRFANHHVRLDPGAIGKGYALDRAVAQLQEVGVQSALLHGGTSSVIALGNPPEDERGWAISLQHPLFPHEQIVTFYLNNRALGVSAEHGRAFTVGGQTFGHIIDPRTGYPVRKSVLSACLAPTGALADALSTALLVSGATELPILKSRFPEVAFLIVEREDDREALSLKTCGDWPMNPDT
jgi:thiamine biosynthesis lipoprotein